MKEFFKKIGRGIVKGAIYIYCKVVYRVKVVGKENIPKKGPIIICGNQYNFYEMRRFLRAHTRACSHYISNRIKSP